MSIKNKEAIHRVNVIKYLVIMIDENLSFDYRSKYIVNIDKNYRIKVYNSIVLPHFVYCPSILFLLNTIQKDKLLTLQNIATRIILIKRYNTYIGSMLN